MKQIFKIGFAVFLVVSIGNCQTSGGSSKNRNLCSGTSATGTFGAQIESWLSKFPAFDNGGIKHDMSWYLIGQNIPQRSTADAYKVALPKLGYRQQETVKGGYNYSFTNKYYDSETAVSVADYTSPLRSGLLVESMVICHIKGGHASSAPFNTEFGADMPTWKITSVSYNLSWNSVDMEALTPHFQTYYNTLQRSGFTCNKSKGAWNCKRQDSKNIFYAWYAFVSGDMTQMYISRSIL